MVSNLLLFRLPTSSSTWKNIREMLPCLGLMVTCSSLKTESNSLDVKVSDAQAAFCVQINQLRSVHLNRPGSDLKAFSPQPT